ncbi:hemerythrin domain-containing protein [Mesorhizobium neociceri]|uniref:hemerythrin domain-containing protein n=1 Tax=Mesorhizobium neociceri TaxID=1307853 RepID=UPI001F414E26|nr:hemerythrin domain-containing protein [Mesorhizobium neociceri]
MNQKTQNGLPRSWTTLASSVRARAEMAPGDLMNLAHLEKLRLCSALESIADGLPNVDCARWLGTANAIVPLLRDIHNFEETVIFPAYKACLTSAEVDLGTTGRLRLEHIKDQCFAGELAETLLAIGKGDPIESAEAIGFMLRGFFEGLRRHIAFEREHILPRIGVADAGTPG